MGGKKADYVYDQPSLNTLGIWLCQDNFLAVAFADKGRKYPKVQEGNYSLRRRASASSVIHNDSVSKVLDHERLTSSKSLRSHLIVE